VKFEEYIPKPDGLLRFQGRMYISKEGGKRRTILKGSHRALYYAHPGVNKMYIDMKKLFFG